MLEQLKGLTRDSAIYGAGHIATRLLTFLLLPYYSHRLTPAEYGEITLYFIFIGVVQTFFLYGMDIAYLRYFNLARASEDRARITGSTVLASLLSSALLTGLIILFARECGSLLIHESTDPDRVPDYIRICAGILFFDTLSTFPFLLLRSRRKTIPFAGIKLLNVVINLALNIYLIGVLNWTINGVLWANLAASVVTALIMFPEILREWQLTLDWRLLREMVGFGLPNIPTYLFVMVIEFSSRKILELFKGLDVAGIYSAGYKLGMFMAVVTAAFRFAWQPFFLSHADDPNAPRLFARVMTYYILVTCSLLLLLSYFVEPIVKADLPGIGHLIDSRYWAGLSIFPLIMLAHIFDGIYANLMVGVYIKKLTSRLPIVTGIAAAFNVGANLLLIPSYGMVAAAWITLISFMIQAGLLWLVVRNAYAVPYETARIVRIFAVSCSLLLIGLLPAFSSLWTRALLLIAFPLMLLLTGFVDSREKAYLKRLLPVG